jgi:zinc-ribbon domain
MEMYCHKCGKEIPEDSAYCPSCGTKVGGYSPADYWWERRRWQRERRPRHEWDPMDTALAAVRGVGFLVILGLTVVQYPDVFVLMFRYLESWGTYGYPVLPPHALGQVIIFLFTAGGAWGLVSSGLRLGFSHRLRGPMRDIVSAVFSLYIAYVFTLFYAGTIRGSVLVLDFFVGLAAVVVVSALITGFVPRRKDQERVSPG